MSIVIYRVEHKESGKGIFHTAGNNVSEISQEGVWEFKELMQQGYTKHDTPVEEVPLDESTIFDADKFFYFGERRGTALENYEGGLCGVPTLYHLKTWLSDKGDGCFLDKVMIKAIEVGFKLYKITLKPNSHYYLTQTQSVYFKEEVDKKEELYFNSILTGEENFK